MTSNNVPVNKETGEIKEKGLQIIPKAPVGSVRNVTGLFNNPSVKALVGKGMSTVMSLDHLAKMAIVAITRQPKLLECTQESFLFALTTAGQLGVDPSGSLGRAYIIPYYNKAKKVMEAQFQLGYKGYIDLVCRAGMAKSIMVHVVWKDEADSMQWGKESVMRHVPKWDVKRDYTSNGSKDVAFFYMVANHGKGIFSFSYMSNYEVEDTRRRFSKMPDGKGWKDSYVEMGKKTMIIRGSKTLPMSTEHVHLEAANQFQQAIASELPEEADYEEIVIDPNELPVTEKIPESDKPKAGSVNENRTPISKWKSDYKDEKITYSDWEAVRDQYPDDERKEFENWVAVQP